MNSLSITQRIAAAPISWGVCEVPDWGYQLEAARVLGDMARLGIVASEFGPEGFLPDDPEEKKEMLESFGLRAVGGFVPVVLHDAFQDPVEHIRSLLPSFHATNSKVLVLAAVSGEDGYDSRPQLTEEEWRVLYKNISDVDALVQAEGIVPTLHPHAGTIIETRKEVQRILDFTNVLLCLDTGHLMVGGTDPVEIAKEYPNRIGHVHLKDVVKPLIDELRSGQKSYTQAVAEGLYVPLGEGDVDLNTLIQSLESSGYQGLYVLEQDVILDDDPQQLQVPVDNVARSIDFLKNIDELR